MTIDTARLKAAANDLFIRILSLPGVSGIIDRRTVNTADLRALGSDSDAVWTYAPARTITFDDPDCFNGRFPTLEAKIGAHRVDPAFVAELQDVELVGRNAISIAADGRWILENAGQSEQLLLREVLATAMSGTLPVRRGPGATVSQLDTAISMVGPWSREYFHWFSEWLPRLAGVERYEEQTGRRPTLLVPEDPPQWLTDSLQLVGYDAWTQWSGGRARVDRLVVPSLRRAYPVDNPHAGYTNAPAGYDWVRSRTIERLDVDRASSYAPRIYVSRAGASTRRVLNEDEVVTALRDLGFEPYRLEDVPFRDQVAMFANAETVIGPHGAGLVNALFGTDLTLVELFGSYVNACYFTMAEGLGHEYACLGCEPVGPDLRVDVDALVERLDRLIA